MSSKKHRKKLRELYNVNIISKSGRNGGYMYYE